MVQIICCCNENLNRNSNKPLSDEITNELLIGTSPIILLSTINLKRKIIKLYIVQSSHPSNKIWVQHGKSININNFAFPLLLQKLYVNELQAHQPLSVVSNEGTALLKFTVVNEL